MSFWELVVDHDYGTRNAFDRSMNGNHGYRTAAIAKTGTRNALKYDGTGRLIIPPSEKLVALGGIRLEADFLLSERKWPKRRNIAEGHMAFAIFVNPDLSIQATLFNGNQWDGPRSVAGAVVTGKWTRASYIYGGVGGATLYLDQSEVASRNDLQGQVPGVSGGGIEIGHWPAGDDRYTMDGYIGSFRLWRLKEHSLRSILCGRTYNAEQAQTWSKIACHLHDISQEEIAEYGKELSEAIRRLVENLLRGRKSLRRRVAALGPFFYRYLCDPCDRGLNTKRNEVGRVFEEVTQTIAEEVPLEDRIEILRQFREWEIANPIPFGVLEARQMLAQADPRFRRFLALARGMIIRNLLADIPKVLWPEQFINPNSG